MCQDTFSFSITDGAKNARVLFGGSDFWQKNRASSMRNLFRKGKTWYTEGGKSGFEGVINENC